MINTQLIKGLLEIFFWKRFLSPFEQTSVQVMSSISSSEKIIPTTIEYLDIAGLVKGASQGEGLGNKFLSNIRECDSIVQVTYIYRQFSNLPAISSPEFWRICIGHYSVL